MNYVNKGIFIFKRRLGLSLIEIVLPEDEQDDPVRDIGCSRNIYRYV